MRRVLAAAVLLAFVPTAHAQDKGKADLSTNAEYRARYFYMQNPGANENTLRSQSMAEGRFKLGLNYKASEKISATLTLLHNTNFGVDNNNSLLGSSSAETINQSPAGNVASGNGETLNSGDNLVSVNQAFVTWMAAEDLMFMVGRMNLQLGDGSLIGLNDWQKQPLAWEGVLGGWEQEWGKVWLGGYKMRNLQTTGANTSASGDPEHNVYILAFDLKAMPEWMKAMNVHVVKNNADAVPGGLNNQAANTTKGMDTLRYGTNLAFGFGAFDVKAWWEKQSGKIKQVTAAPALVKSELDYSGDMMALEAGFSVPKFMGSRFFAKYHKDSGDDNIGDTDLGGYDAYAYEAHNSAGAMDLFGWGNLTFMNVGWTLKTDEKTHLGLAYYMFTRTESSATSQTPTPGIYGVGLPTAANDKDDLGSELDVWATHIYNPGLSTTLRIGYFTPGDYYKDAATNNSSDKILHVMVEGKATF